MLLTFGLDGKALLPPSAPPDMTVKALASAIPKRRTNRRPFRGLFMACAVCHGRDLVSAGAPAPDLRESQVALNPDNFWMVVHEGVLIQRGMPRFETLTREQVMQIYAYIRAGAREAH